MICKDLKPFNLPGLPPQNVSCYQHCFEFNFTLITFSLIYSQGSLKAGLLKQNSLYHAARIANFEGIVGFSVPSIFVAKTGLRQITMQRAHPALLRMTLDCSSIVKEIVMVSGFFVTGRRQMLLYSCK